jgi:hypothetical protein
MVVCYKDHIFGQVYIMTACLCFWSRNISTYWNIYHILVLLFCLIIHIIPKLKIFKWSYSVLLEDNLGFVMTLLKGLSQSDV